MVMVSNQTGVEVGLLAGKHPGLVGHLFSPTAQRGPWREIPYALDNGAWPAHLSGEEWNVDEWRHLLRWAALCGVPPLWAVVPDVVGNRAETLARWPQYVEEVRALGFRPAFAVQDGMAFEDVPDHECMLFIGGSDAFKDAAIDPWCTRFPGRVHVARVNGWDRLTRCWKAGAVSVDGTGWFNKGRGGYSQHADLRKFLRETDRLAVVMEQATASVLARRTARSRGGK
jgi:hypothetical protein